MRLARHQHAKCVRYWLRKFCLDYCSFVSIRGLHCAKTNFMEFTGGCVCWRDAYVLKSRPLALVDCHCIDCRRSAGAPYVSVGIDARADLVVTKGEPRRIAYTNRIRSFAACCGTHLFFEDSKDSDTIDFTIASLDDPAIFRRKRFSSKTNCRGLLSMSRFRRSRQFQREKLND